MRILVVNAGSTSVKLRVVEPNDAISDREDLGSPGDDLSDQLDQFLQRAGPLDAAGHRVVHGGPDFVEPRKIDADVRAGLERLNELAPLHNPPALRAIDALQHLKRDLAQVACFDTAFHAHLPAESRVYALPATWVREWGLRRYGFHGLSCEWATHRAAELLDVEVERLKLVICHLGGGDSVTAVDRGRSVDTTMGFTPTEGLIMATRSGDVDPGLIAWLAGRVPPSELMEALERRSGLLALTEGRTGDMKELLDGRANGDWKSRTAVDAYLHRLRAKVAGMTAALGGLDALVFTGGIGEHAAAIREETCSGLAWMGLAIDPAANTRVTDGADSDISAANATARTLVVDAREEVVIARASRALFSPGG
jgi:acetate kinase